MLVCALHATISCNDNIHCQKKIQHILFISLKPLLVCALHATTSVIVIVQHSPGASALWAAVIALSTGVPKGECETEEM